MERYGFRTKTKKTCFVQRSDGFFERDIEEPSQMSRMLFASIVERKLFSSILRALGTGE